jgi:hypothetical protein
MKKLSFFTLSLLLCCVMSAQAAQLRIYVSDMNAIGVTNKDEMKATLQMLLSSRLNSDKILAVASAGEADALVTGTYISIGKVFSIDALVKTYAGKTLARSFVQGENQEELIPAVGKLAEKLSAEIGKLPAGSIELSANAPVKAGRSDFIRQDQQQIRQVPSSGFIKATDRDQLSVKGGWQSRRLKGVANLMATGRTLSDGTREVFLAEDRKLAYYRQGDDLKLLAEREFKHTEKVISLDAIEVSDGVTDVYVTIIRAGELASQLWQVKGDKLVLVADDLPYFFRSLSLAGGPKKIYAQSMGRDTDFYGAVGEVVRTGSAVSTKNPIKLPRFGDIYSFNQLRDQDGRIHTIVINQDSYLVVYDQEMKEVWRSNDKFGGSELFFQREDANPRVTGDKFRSIFMNQKVQVTSRGEVLVGKNEGLWVLGDARSYKKGSVYCLVWDGSSLEEKWRTRDTQSYMPDYYYDEGRNELMLLQTVQRTGFGTTGASTVAIKKVE